MTRTRLLLALALSHPCSAVSVRAGDVADRYTGAGVILGVIDEGVDWWHPDLTRDGASRILYLWDQRGKDATRRPVEGFGTEWTGRDLDAARAGDLTIDHEDDTGETTVGLLLAAGNGTYRRANRGFAEDAKLIVVSPEPTVRGILRAARYIARKVDELERESGPKKLVISIAQGTHLSTHHRPGQLDDFFASITGPDRIVVASAGNARGAAIHASSVLTPESDRITFPFEIPEDVASSSQFWLLTIYPKDAVVTCGVSIDGTDILVPRGGDEEVATPYGTVRMHNAAKSRLSTTLENEFILLIETERGESPARGEWALVFDPVHVSHPGAVDSWIAWPKPKPDVDDVRFLEHVDDTELVEWPASATGVIAVGAYDGDSGTLYRYSSPGWWTSGGGTKPDIAAPGVGIERILTTRDRRTDTPVRTSGTSLSAPYVAGCIALLLEASPVPLTPEIVLSILCDSVVAEHGRRPAPDIDWGCGPFDPDRLVVPN